MSPRKPHPSCMAGADPFLARMAPWECDNVVRLDVWSCTSDEPYMAPELNLQLQGIPTGHPRKPDGKRIITSRVDDAQGRFARTASGTVYYLGTIDPAYRKYLRKHRPSWDWRNPIKLLTPEDVEPAQEPRTCPRCGDVLSRPHACPCQL